MKRQSLMKIQMLHPLPSNGSMGKTSMVLQSKYRSLSGKTLGPAESPAAVAAAATAVAAAVVEEASVAAEAEAAAVAGAGAAAEAEEVAAMDPRPVTEKAIGDVATLAVETLTSHGEKLVIGKHYSQYAKNTSYIFLYKCSRVITFCLTIYFQS